MVFLITCLIIKSIFLYFFFSKSCKDNESLKVKLWLWNKNAKIEYVERSLSRFNFVFLYFLLTFCLRELLNYVTVYGECGSNLYLGICRVNLFLLSICTIFAIDSENQCNWNVFCFCLHLHYLCIVRNRLCPGIIKWICFYSRRILSLQLKKGT